MSVAGNDVAVRGKGSPNPDATLSDWLDYLEELHPKGQAGIELGLERVCRVKKELKQHQHCPVILVGGTNGKGSTCAFLESILHFSGYHVGCYTSPHLFAYNERVQFGREPVSDELLCKAFAKVEAARLRAGAVALTYFEFGTLAAWEIFAEAGTDVAILEVGLGGRLDAVNAYDADVAIVTSIDIDHTDWLGMTREMIGFEKAGIFRAGKPSCYGDLDPPKSLLDHAHALGVDLTLYGQDFGCKRTEHSKGWEWWGQGLSRKNLPAPKMSGETQYRNATVALAALQKLDLPVTDTAIEQGLRETVVTGRFQIVQEKPLVIVDVAHNPQSVGALAENIDHMRVTGRTFAIVGMLADKDAGAALEALKGKIDAWHLASLDGVRGAPAVRLEAIVKKQNLGGEIFLYDSPQKALQGVRGRAVESDRILAFGSFYTVAGVMEALRYGR